MKSEDIFTNGESMKIVQRDDLVEQGKEEK
jgi:hypothetical protein